MRTVIVEGIEWAAYADTWNQAMRDFYWYQDSPVFDFNSDEELAEMKSSFGQDGHLFLAGKSKRSDAIQAVMGTQHNGEFVSLRRWEPAVPEPLRESNLGRDLLRFSMKHARKTGAKRMRVLVKHPHDAPETWLTLVGWPCFDPVADRFMASLMIGFGVSSLLDYRAKRGRRWKLPSWLR